MSKTIENPCFHCYAGAVGGYCRGCKDWSIGKGEIETEYVEVESEVTNEQILRE